MHQVDLIRGYTLQKLRQLRIYISMLPVREQTALERLHGPEGVKTAARITDFVLEQLGHTAPDFNNSSPTVRAAREFVPPIIDTPKHIGSKNKPKEEPAIQIAQ